MKISRIFSTQVMSYFIDVSISLMAMLTTFSLSIVYFTKMVVAAAPRYRNKRAVGNFGSSEAMTRDGQSAV